jgi:hypothetical protein
MDFQGIEFTAMTENEPPALVLDAQYKREGIFYPENQTTDVTGFVSGAYIEIWRILETELNFTTRYYKRLDNKWGNLLDNGTWIGMVSNIMNGQADFVVAPIASLPIRYVFLNAYKVFFLSF